MSRSTVLDNKDQQSQSSNISLYPYHEVSLESLMNKLQVSEVVDNYEILLEEIFTILNPHISPLLPNFKKDFLDFKSKGVPAFWIYYPWDQKLVSFLEEEMHYNLITARNRNLVSKEEHAVLRSFNIGVIGMSVGQSALYSIVKSGISHNIKISDYDRLSGSNLNRLDGGFDNIGILKTDLAKRKLLKLNPYLNIMQYGKISQENMEDFLLNPFKLDVVIDAFDSIQTKITLRRLAKKYGINVVMGTDLGDGALINLEEPSDPAFLGALELTELEELEKSEVISMEDMFKIVPKILGVDFPEKMIKHMSSMRKEVNWVPQLFLASSLAGSCVAYVVKQLALGNKNIKRKTYLNLDLILNE